MNKQIEEKASKCDVRLRSRPKQQKEPMTIHPISSLPWNKVGTDLFEHEGSHYLILVDYYSNFIEVVPFIRATRSVTVIKHIKANIARYGIIETLISDNAPQYTSDAFRKLSSHMALDAFTSNDQHAYHQSNGLAEKTVQTVQNMIV